MKQKLIIGFSVLLLLGVFYLISRDLFVNNQASEKNPCEYNLDKLKAIDTSVIRYKETRHFKPSLASPRGIAIDEKATVYIAGANEVQVYNPEWKKLAGFKIDSPANCIAVGIKREIYLGTGNHVEKYSITGVLLSRWKEINKKGFITSIAVNSSQVFVADAGNH